MDKLKYILQRIFLKMLGLGGGNLTVSDTSTYTGQWAALYVCSTAVISAITIDDAVDTGLAGVASWSAGQIIYGNITSIKLTSGVVRMYGGAISNVTTEMGE